jgi:ribosomal protein S16
MGRIHAPFFRLSAIDSRTPRDGRVIEELGHYDPMIKDKAKRFVVKLDRATLLVECRRDSVGDRVVAAEAGWCRAQEPAVAQAGQAETGGGRRPRKSGSQPHNVRVKVRRVG